MNPQSESAKSLLLLLRQDPIPKEFEITILPIDELKAKEDQDDFVKVNIYLGINALSLPILAHNFRRDYYALRPTFISSRNKLHLKTNEFISLNQGLIDSTTCLLMLCPDNDTAWADRRHALLLSNRRNSDDNDPSYHQSLWDGEISFLDMLFSQHSKAPNAWSHRKFICQQIVTDIQNSLVDKTRTVESSQTWQLLISWAGHEIEQCVKVAERFPKNYYAWTHRSYIIRSLVDLCATESPLIYHPNKNNEPIDLVLKLLEEEAHSTNPWLRKHVSDHSAAHYGGEVLRTLLRFVDLRPKLKIRNVSWKIDMIQKQLDESRRLALLFRSHEVFWIWRRICSSILLETLDELSSHLTSFVSETIFTRTIDLFIDIDVNQTFENYSSEIQSDADYQRGKLHCYSYIMWIIEHIKRFTNKNLDLSKYNLDILEAKVLDSLSKNDCICHNMWRIKMMDGQCE